MWLAVLLRQAYGQFRQDGKAGPDSCKKSSGEVALWETKKVQRKTCSPLSSVNWNSISLVRVITMRSNRRWARI